MPIEQRVGLQRDHRQLRQLIKALAGSEENDESIPTSAGVHDAVACGSGRGGGAGHGNLLDHDEAANAVNRFV